MNFHMKPTIMSVGSPPERHAERVVAEMLTFLHAYVCNVMDRSKGVIQPDRMGNPKAQHRHARRIGTSLAPMLLERPRLRAGKRGKFELSFIYFHVWDTLAGVPCFSGPPPANPALAVSMHMEMRTKGGSVTMMIVSRHACVRLAQRAGVRTIEELLEALCDLWRAHGLLLERYNCGKQWQASPAGGWLVELESGAIAVFEPDNSDPKHYRLFVPTILEPDMVHGRPINKEEKA